MDYKILHKEDIGEELLPMSEINDHLRVYDPHEEALLEVYRAAGLDFAERYMNRAVSQWTVKAFVPAGVVAVVLPLGDVIRIDSLTDTEGLEIDYKFNSVTNRVTFFPRVGTEGFYITYRVGFIDVPKAIKLGILKLIATWFENREDISNGVSVQEVPFSHKACFDLYRLPSGL